jgi:hypothetical protein
LVALSVVERGDSGMTVESGPVVDSTAVLDSVAVVDWVVDFRFMVL